MRILQRAWSNLGTLVLALLLAFVIWVAANLQVDPFEDKAILNVPVVLANQARNTVLYEPVIERVTVTARARSSVAAKLKPADFSAIVDLSALEPGTPASVPISVTTTNDAVRVEAITPDAQVVHLEAVGVLTLPIELAVRGDSATGYWHSNTQVVPTYVVISGPVPLLSQVVSATASIDITGAKEDVIEQVGVVLLDSKGQAVADLTVQPARIGVRLEFRRRLGYKPDVEVVPDLRGDPAEGYRLGSVSVEPQTVTLAGIPAILDSLPGFVETLPISVTGATRNLTQRMPLTVPNSVVVVGYDYVTVTVEVLPIQSSRAMTVAVGFQGLALGWVATPSPAVVDVILEGPNTILSGLKSTDLRIVLNLFGLPLGLHRLVPEVLAPEEVSVVSVIPEKVEVTISIAPTVTPFPTLTPVPTATKSP
jgi:YbbR domain-containing protein